MKNIYILPYQIVATNDDQQYYSVCVCVCWGGGAYMRYYIGAEGFYQGSVASVIRLMVPIAV